MQYFYRRDDSVQIKMIIVCFLMVAGNAFAADSSNRKALPTHATPVLQAALDDGVQQVTAGKVKDLSATYTSPQAKAVSAKHQNNAAQSNGLMLSTHEQGVVYSAPQLIDGRSGTISIWFRPDNWDNLGKQGYNPRAPRVPLITLMTETAGADRNNPPLISVSITPEQLRDRPKAIELGPDQWRQLVVVWMPDINTGLYRTSKDDLRIYLDGQRLDQQVRDYGQTIFATHDDPGPDARVTQLIIGPTQSRNNLELKTTFVRDMQLYERALSDIEVANLYKKQSASTEQLQAPADVQVTCQLNPALQRIDLHTLLLADVKAETMDWQLTSHRDDSEKSIAQRLSLPVTNRWAGGQQDQIPIKWGKAHKLELTWRDAQGKIVFQHNEDITTQPAPVWLNSSFGEHPGKALPGFEPVKLAPNGDLMLWERRIAFASSGMPEQITAVGKPLLAKPIRLQLQTTAGPVSLQSQGSARVLSHDDEQATVEGVMAANGWQVTTQSRTEFDGMIKFTMRLEPPKNNRQKVSQLKVIIPVHAEIAERYSLGTGRGFGFRAGNGHEVLPGKDGIFFDSSKHDYATARKHRGAFIPFFMFNDTHRGLAWFSESDKGWTVNDKSAAIAARRQGDKVLLELNIIREPTEMIEPIEYVFGLHVLPIRTLAADHRTFGNSLDPSAVDAFMPPSFRTKVHRADKNALWPHDGWEEVKKRLAIRDAKLKKVSERSTRPFEGSLFYLSRQWPGLPPESLLFQPKWYLPGFIHHTDNYIDCFTYWAQQWLEQTNIRGFYIDDIWPSAMNDPLEGPAYYLPDGTVQAGYDFFNQRELLKRLRWTFHDTGRRPVIWVHCTQTLYPNLIGFAEAFYDGEMHGMVKGDHFGERWPIHRLEFDRGRLWGVSPVFMNINKTKDKVKRYKDMRSFVGEMFLQDLGFSFTAPYLREHIDMFHWRTDDLKFVAYDDPEPLAKSNHESVYVSSYYRGTSSNPSQAYLVLVNRSDKPVQTHIELDKTIDRHGATQWVDIDTWFNDELGKGASKQTLSTIEAGKLKLTIRPWDFRLITWKRH